MGCTCRERMIATPSLLCWSATPVSFPIMRCLLVQEEGFKYLSLKPGDKVAILVNNLGGSTTMELSIAMRAAIAELEGPKYGCSVERAFSGPFMTALDMVGISVSVLKLSGDMASALDAPCAAPAWPGAGRLVGPVPRQRRAPVGRWGVCGV